MELKAPVVRVLETVHAMQNEVNVAGAEFIVTGGGMSRGSIGLGFAIASNLARQVTDSLIEHGEVIRPFLGISMQPLDEALGKQFGV